MKNKTKCSVEICDRDVHTTGLCRAHYSRKRAGYDLNSPIKSVAKKGDWGPWLTNQEGYVFRRRRKADGSRERQMQHRKVMEDFLGRPLTELETVHHINGTKNDNRIENLQLRQGDHGQGVVFACLDCGSHRVVPVELPEEHNTPISSSGSG